MLQEIVRFGIYSNLERKRKEALISSEAWLDRSVVELDLRGSVCPGPTADTLLALKKLPPGGKLVVTTDYLPARQTIPRLLEERGYFWQMTEVDGKTFRLEIMKGDG